MGAWGIGLFSDDTACDIRDDYREYVGEGLSGPEATDRLLTEYADSVDDLDDGPVFWLALAATQWKCGRLEDRVKQRALEVIASGVDLDRWQSDPRLIKKREKMLSALREKFESPQPPEKRIPKRFKDTCDWQIGELIAYTLRSGNKIIMRVIGYHTDKGGTSPIVEILDWCSETIPTSRKLRSLRTLKHRTRKPWKLIIGRISKRELPVRRIERLNIVSKPAQDGAFGIGATVMLWRMLDEYLEEWHQLR